MSITKEVKKDLISKFSINDKDTGSAEVQIADQTQRQGLIIYLLKELQIQHMGFIQLHFKQHLFQMVQKHYQQEYLYLQDLEELLVILPYHQIMKVILGGMMFMRIFT
jgi:hypothetical protein